MNKKKILIIMGFVISALVICFSIYKIVEKKNIVDKDSKGEVLNKHTKIKEDIKNDDNTNDNEESTMIVNDVNNYSDDNIYVDKIVDDVDVDNVIVKKLYSYVAGSTEVYPQCKVNSDYSIKYPDAGLPYDLSGYMYKSNMKSNDIPDKIKIGMVNHTLMLL